MKKWKFEELAVEGKSRWKKMKWTKIWKNWQLRVSPDEKMKNLKKLTIKGKSRQEKKGETCFWQFVDRKPNQVGTYEKKGWDPLLAACGS